MKTTPAPAPEVAAQVDRARQFLRDIRDAVARHPVASKNCEIRLHERRDRTASVLRMSGTVDGVPVQLLVHVDDHAPTRPRIEYSPLLEYLRSGPVMSIGASALAAAHDHACCTHYPESESWQQTVRHAMAQARIFRGSLN